MSEIGKDFENYGVPFYVSDLFKNYFHLKLSERKKEIFNVMAKLKEFEWLN